MTSHSPVVLGKCLALGERASVYELYMQSQQNLIVAQRAVLKPSEWDGRLTHHYDGLEDMEADLSEQSTKFTHVRKIESGAAKAFEDLGASGADVLQCNGVIWVEGPSDVIYLRAWLDMYAREYQRPIFHQGQHYEFQMYGGALLASLCLQRESSGRQASERKKLIEMFSFSRNSYVVMDSDAVAVDGGLVEDKSTYSASKSFIKGQIDELNDEGFQLGLWFAENNTDLRTIECYLDAESLEICSQSKPEAARRRVRSWGSKSMSCFPDASREIAKLYNLIRRWQPD